MNGKPSLDELIDVRDHFGLPSAGLVEKDWYVVRALAAIDKVDSGEFRFVFGGGTALSRAHKLTKRMSEDVDFKIVSEAAPSRGALRVLRQKVTNSLLGAGFQFDPDNEAHLVSMYKSHYTKYQLPYSPEAEGKGMRSCIQIEMSVWPTRRPTVEKPIASFYAEACGHHPEVASMACSSVLETAAEKLVALGWRAGSELAGLREERDPTLVRHIYDLHMTRAQYEPAETARLAHEIMKSDAAIRGDKFPAWQKDPLGETLRAFERIPDDNFFVEGYAIFQRDMVYGEKPDFATAMASLNLLRDQLAALGT